MTKGNARRNSAVVEAAQALLENRQRHRTEGNVQSDVEALLRTMCVGSIESKYQLGKEQADIYLPNRRAFIECKKHPKAADPEKPQSGEKRESAAAQVGRYVRTEIENELRMLPGFSMGIPSSPWLGIVTDGSHWHVYQYTHQADAQGTLKMSRTFLNEGDALAEFLSGTLGARMVGKEWIPEKPSDLFSELKKTLDDLYRSLPRKAEEPTRTKRELWLDMMRTSGMVPKDEAGQTRLFLAHSFLIITARLVSQTLRGAQAGTSWTEALRDGFASWVLDFDRGKAWTHKVWQRVDKYDWRRRRGDVLRNLYHRYVREEDRKVFGEFYTPDWLAALMVEELLDEDWLEKATTTVLENSRPEGTGVLDPACGSGTFLYHAALRILESPSVQGLSPVQQSNIVTHLVNGMDIHPVAVEMARVNIERALPAEPTEGRSALQVFLGDSLQAETRGKMLFGHTNDAMVLTTPRGDQVHIPMEFVQEQSFAEKMRRVVNAAAQGKPLPPGTARKETRDALKECHRKLTQIIDSEGNSVWTWYAVNIAGPYLLAKRKIDRVIGNPPWVRLSDIQDKDRKRAMEACGEDQGLQAGGKLAPHLDIASYFVVRTRELYANEPSRDPGAWLVKKSAINAGQWGLFRRKHARTLAQTVDLQDLNPFGGGDATRCCLLMEHRRLAGTTGKQMKARRVAKGSRRPQPEEGLDTARTRFELVEAPEPLPQAPSHYNSREIKQGATIVPHALAVIKSWSAAAEPEWAHVETKGSLHQPWASIAKQEGKIPIAWIRAMHTSKDLLPYRAQRKPPHAIVPINQYGELHNDPGKACRFWRELDEVYDAHRGHGRETPKTLIKRFDYAKNLSAQPLNAQQRQPMVLYPASGDIMRAARAEAGAGIVDASLYWLATGSNDEAGYLTALLNANCLRRAFAECRESERHFHLHPWRKVPIPRYDEQNGQHQRLAELCQTAEGIATQRMEAELAERPTLKQTGLSEAIRKAVQESDEGQEIERIVRGLLPAQAN